MVSPTEFLSSFVTRSFCLIAKQWRKAGENFEKDLVRRMAGRFGAAFLPIQTLEMIGQYDTCNGQPGWQGHFKRITFDLACHRADEGEARFGVVGCRG